MAISKDRLKKIEEFEEKIGYSFNDKEFRYLRTFIVTAAVYWGFNSNLRFR